MSKARDIASAAPAPSTVSATELGYLDGVSSAIQTQLNDKQAVVSGVDDTEIGYLNGVTSAIQTQIDSKIGSASAISPTLIDAKGDLIVGSADNTAARLAVGTNNYVLTADSAETNGVKWAAVSAGGMTLLSNTALSGSSVFIGDISQSYTNLILFITSYTFSTSTTLQMRVNGNPNYHYVNVLSSNGTVNNGLQTSINVSPAHSSQTDSFSVVEIPDYSGGGKPQIYKVNTISAWNHGVSANQMNNIGGSSPSTTPVSSITLFPASGTFTGGTVRIYGVK
jgi:hypothetical protein